MIKIKSETRVLKHSKHRDWMLTISMATEGCRLSQGMVLTTVSRVKPQAQVPPLEQETELDVWLIVCFVLLQVLHCLGVPTAPVSSKLSEGVKLW